MPAKHDVLTTGEVAKICNVAPRTVAKWFDRGDLRGYRIPGSKDRRIPTAQLIKFMRAHDMPLNGLETGQVRILLLDADRRWSEAVAAGLTSDQTYEVRTAESAFEGGYWVPVFKPHVLVVDDEVGDFQADNLGRLVRSLTDLEGVKLIATGRNMDARRGQALRQVGFHATLSKPFELSRLIAAVDDVLSGDA